jgi:hypothetical protein
MISPSYDGENAGFDATPKAKRKRVPFGKAEPNVILEDDGEFHHPLYASISFLERKHASFGHIKLLTRG